MRDPVLVEQVFSLRVGEGPSDTAEVVEFGEFSAYLNPSELEYQDETTQGIKTQAWVDYRGEHGIPLVVLDEKFIETDTGRVLAETRRSYYDVLDLSQESDPWPLESCTAIDKSVVQFNIERTLLLYETDCFTKEPIELPANGASEFSEAWQIENLEVLKWRVTRSAEPPSANDPVPMDGGGAHPPYDKYLIEAEVCNKGSTRMDVVLIRPFITTRKGYSLYGLPLVSSGLNPGESRCLSGSFVLSRDAQVHGPTKVNLAFTYIDEPVRIQLPTEEVVLI